MQWITKTLFLALVIVFGTNAEAQEYRTIDGFNNNRNNPELGASHSMMAYWTSLDYADGIGIPKMNMDFSRPNPRMISNQLFAQADLIPDHTELSDYTWVFGQFVDHDITLVENSPFELLDNIVVPEDDQHFTPGQLIPMLRNLPADGTGTSIDNPRRHINLISAFLDLSSVYGSDPNTAQWLRGEKGLLKVSEGNLLPWNTVDGEFNSRLDMDAPVMADDTRVLKKYFVAGDIRANENPLLLAFHTLFVREHNRLAKEFSEKNPDWNSEEIYQEARKWNIAFYQSIVFNEWLPAMGIQLPNYGGYQEDVDPSISNVFSAAAFRVGHTLINGTILRMDNDGNEMAQGNVALRDAFFNPYMISLGNGIEPYFKGMGAQIQQQLDCKIIDDVRNFLFGAPGQGGLDLAAININRGRERGLGSFNSIREDLGLPIISSFQNLTANNDEAAILEEVYQNIDHLDPWVGMLAEDKIPNTIFGKTMFTVLERQFQALRDGDRFFYMNEDYFSPSEKTEVNNTILYDILLRNTDLEIMQHELFKAKTHKDVLGGPELETEDFYAIAYPNPVINDLTVKLYSSVERNAQIRVMSYTGQLVTSFTQALQEGENYIDIYMDDNTCPRGLYNIVVNFGDKFTVLKVIKEK